VEVILGRSQWRRQDFVTGGKVRYGSVGGLEYEAPPVPVVLSVYQRGSLLYGLAMYLSCDTKKFHGNESTHILHNFWTSTHRGEASPLPPGGATGRSNTRGGSVAEWLACWTHRHFLTPICTDGLSAWVELAALPQTP